MGQLALGERVRERVLVGSLAEPSQQAARIADRADGNDRDQRPPGGDDQRRRPRLEGDGEPLERGPAQRGKGEEERRCGNERSSHVHPQLADLRRTLHGCELEILPHEHRDLVDQVAHQRFPRGARLG